MPEDWLGTNHSKRKDDDDDKKEVKDSIVALLVVFAVVGSRLHKSIPRSLLPMPPSIDHDAAPGGAPS
jgi:hypothetical protein